MTFGTNRNNLLPASAWTTFNPHLCVVWLDDKKADYVLPARMIDCLQDGGDEIVWFIDDMDNCIRVALRIEGNKMWFTRKDMDVIKSLYPPGQILLAHIEYRRSGVISLYVTTDENKQLMPKLEASLFAGRILPQQIQDKIKET
ncbi:hypothetical protein PIB30_033053 [Stylosanthes scabra]|uniref:Uncharacterized protein n=1 Tax=Stylosanthes scabra TaxID=79078 RepID=A0ABU6Y9L1_9FABA|nr:hypothetical protein [Stylosanthes scabra]